MRCSHTVLYPRDNFTFSLFCASLLFEYHYTLFFFLQPFSFQTALTDFSARCTLNRVIRFRVKQFALISWWSGRNTCLLAGPNLLRPTASRCWRCINDEWQLLAPTHPTAEQRWTEKRIQLHLKRLRDHFRITSASLSLSSSSSTATHVFH